jgi:hypothetical protein
MNPQDLKDHIIDDITYDIGLRYNGTGNMPDLGEIVSDKERDRRYGL